MIASASRASQGVHAIFGIFTGIIESEVANFVILQQFSPFGGVCDGKLSAIAICAIGGFNDEFDGIFPEPDATESVVAVVAVERIGIGAVLASKNRANGRLDEIFLISLLVIGDAIQCGDDGIGCLREGAFVFETVDTAPEAYARPHVIKAALIVFGILDTFSRFAADGVGEIGAFLVAFAQLIEIFAFEIVEHGGEVFGESRDGGIHGEAGVEGEVEIDGLDGGFEAEGSA